jgi:hypothetical protein
METHPRRLRRHREALRRRYTDPYGTTYNLKDNSSIRPLFVNLGLTVGDFSFRAIVDQYFMEQRDNLDAATSAPTGIRFGSTNLDARYSWKVTKDLTLTPFVLWRDQKPWWVDSVEANVFLFNTTRTRGGLGLGWDLDPAVSLTAGIEYQKDKTDIVPPTLNTFLDGGTRVTYDTKAAYAQLAYQGPVNLTVGARWEDHSAVGSAFVPRAALTKIFGKWHLKVLYANAFRTPAIQNINQPLPGAGTIEPEKTTTAEVEVGVQTGASLFTLNLFDTVIKKPLVYTQIGGNTGYLNQERIGSRGAELEWKLRQSWGFVNANFTWSKAVDNQVSNWSVSGQEDEFLGMSRSKATLAAGLKLPGGFTVGPSLLWFGERYGYAYDPAAGGVTLQKLSSDFLANVSVAWAKDGFRADLGLFDAGDRRRPFVQPYDGGHGPLPGTGREVVLKLRYGF